MAGNTRKIEKDKNEESSKRALLVMQDVRNALHRRLVGYVLNNAEGLRDESNSSENYNFLHQQMDEQILSKLCVASRALAELSQPDLREHQQMMMTTYETVEVIARREELPQKIADALAEHSESDFLDMSVLRADDQQAEVLLVLAREDNGLPPPSTPSAEARPRGGKGETESGEQGGENLGGNKGSEN